MPIVIKHINSLYGVVVFLSTTLALSSCAYFSDYQQRTHFKKLAKNPSPSAIQRVERYTGNAPIRNSYKFELVDAKKKSYSLLFSVHESDFNKSTLAYRDDGYLRKDAERIDNKKAVLDIIKNKLPHANEVTWHNLNNLNTEDAIESYNLMLEYIRYKTLDI